MSSQAVRDLIESGHDPLLLQALARLNEISSSINRLTGMDTGRYDATLRLIVESAIRVVPNASAVLYTYNADRRAFDPVSRVSAGEPSDAGDPEAAGIENDQPRPLGLGIRAVQQARIILSYAEPDLDIHPAKQAAGARAMGCFPLLVGERAVGALYVYLQEERHFSELELLLLSNFVNQAASAIYRAMQMQGIQRSLARKEDELSRLRRAGLLITSRPSLEDTLQIILQMALEVTGARYGIFRLVDRAGLNLITRAIAGERMGSPAVETLPINATSVMGLVAKSRQPLNIPDVRVAPWSRIYYPLDHSLEMHSELAVPLVGAGGRLEGVLNLESPVVEGFSEDDSHLLQALATQAVIAIQEVRLLDALQEMAGLLLTHSCQEVLEHLVELASDLLNTSASAIWILEGDVLALRASSAGHVRGDRLTLEGSLTGEAITSRHPVICDDVRTDPRFAWPNLARAQGWQRALVVPLLAGPGSDPVGAFSVYGTEQDPEQFTASDWDQKVLTILGYYAALAVRNAADQAALRLAQEQRAAAETFAAVGDVAANLLHHLNNKVGTIPVRVEGIEDKRLAILQSDAYLAANLQGIKHSAREAMDQVRESLSLLQPIQLAPVSIAECVADAVADSRLPAGITTKVIRLEGLPAVRGSRRVLALVFVNLLDNAAEAMNGAGQITIQGEVQGDQVDISVTDDGRGISPDLHDLIFELNFSGRRAGRSGKLGFGLWWVKTLMGRLGGAITVNSDGQRGTSFTLHLPCAQCTS